MLRDSWIAPSPGRNRTGGFVIARDAPARIVEHQAGVPHLVRVGAGERRRPADQPDFVLRRGRGEVVLYRPVPVVLAHIHLVAVAQAENAKVLRQRHQTRALARGSRDQFACGGEIRLHLGFGHHLHCRHFELAFSHGRCSSRSVNDGALAIAAVAGPRAVLNFISLALPGGCACVLPAGVSRATFSTLGSAQLPVTKYSYAKAWPSGS